MGLFDFLKGKSKAKEVTSNPKGVTAEQTKKQEPFIEVKSPTVSKTSKTTEKETIKDADGNVYTIVEIRYQVWTVENLKTTKYNDGTPIPLITDKSEWLAFADNKKPAYCWYDNANGNKDKYGALYNWYAVDTGKLAPKGWHVPTDAEWTELKEYLIANGYNWDETKEGSKIAKSMAAKTDWESAFQAGTIGNDLSRNNRSGFSALPGGYRDDYGTFDNQSSLGFWWSATESNASFAYYRNLGSRSRDLGRTDCNKRRGFSLRLVRD